MPTPTTTAAAAVTADSILNQYAADAAYLAGETTPATDLGTLAQHLDTAVARFADNVIDCDEDVESAAIVLHEVHEMDDGPERDLYLSGVTRLLSPLGEMVDEFRDMVAD